MKCKQEEEMAYSLYLKMCLSFSHHLQLQSLTPSPYSLNKGLTPTDTVLLLGAHSVGVVHCSLFKDRLYNFRNTGRPDPTMDPFLEHLLRLRCPLNTPTNNTVNLDQNPFPFMDNSYYQQLLLKRGILPIDQKLALHSLTRGTVMTLATRVFDFPSQFGAAMVKLGGIEVLTGSQGEIRRSCRAFNEH